jgi:hypothetical protein
VIEFKFVPMPPAPQPAKPKGLPVMLRFCKTCENETAHELRRATGLVARICRGCLERAMRTVPSSMDRSSIGGLRYTLR